MLRNESQLKAYKDSEDYSDWIQSQRHAALEHQYKARKWTCNRDEALRNMREKTISYLLSVNVSEISSVTDAMALSNDPYPLPSNKILKNTYLTWFMLPEERESRVKVKRQRNDLTSKIRKATKKKLTAKPTPASPKESTAVMSFEDDERASLSLPEILAHKAKGKYP